ncbi:MAG: lysophospholipase [Candidatus Obscuribacterales bacterium]|nr:lysophospholipase [Candidatus Obscuribacterales bacterium]
MSLRFKVLSLRGALSVLVILVCSVLSFASITQASEQSSASAADAEGASASPEASSPSSNGSASAGGTNPASTAAAVGTARTSNPKSCSPLESKSTSKKSKSKFLDTPPCLTWLDASAEGDPKAVILAVHGLGLHNGTYKDFGERMAKLEYVVYAVDVRGFGSWKAAQGRQKVNFEDCLEDVHKTLKFIHKVHPGLPVFLLGESMGGAIALRVTALYPNLVDGLVSSVPSGDRFKQGETRLKVALKLLTSPNKQFDVGTGVINQATKKAELKELWGQDPLARMNLSANELVQFQSFMNENFHTVKRICNTPVLMVQGKEDKLVKPAGTMALFNNIACKDKQMLLIEHGEHLIFEEGQFDDQVIQDVDKWLKAHLEKKQTGGHISSK